MVVIKIGDKSIYYDGYLKENLDLAKKVIKKDWDFIFVYDGAEGCLSGDTIIRTNRASLGRSFSIKYMYNALNGNPDKIRRLRGWDKNIPTFIRAFDGHSIKLHKIDNVVYSGKKKVYRLLLEDEKSLKLTHEHKVMTNEGFISLKDLDISKHLVMIDTPRPIKSIAHKHKFRDIFLNGLTYHPNGGKKNRRVNLHIAIYEAHINGLEFGEFLNILANDEVKSASLKFLDTSIYCIHHIDGNHYNNNIDNLNILTHEEHLKLHSKIAYKNFSQGIPTFVRIKNIIELGVDDTYDIQCSEPYHNFNANDIIVHNSGKSLKAQQDAFYCDPTLCLERIVFNPTDFKKAVLEAKPFQSIIFDEAYGGLSSRGAMSSVNRILVDMLTQIRQKNLFIFIVLPCFFDLDKYVALWRSRALIHIYCGKNFERGFFAFYNTNKKKDLYIYGKKTYSYAMPNPNFRGRFMNQYVVDKEAYKEKKLNSLSEERVVERTENEIRKKIIHTMVNNLEEIDCLTNDQKASILGMTRMNYYLKRKEIGIVK